MSYNCSKCGKLLTEFDFNFTKNLKGSFNKKSYKCANCLAKTDYLSNIKKPNFFIYIFPYLAITFVALFIKFIDNFTKEEIYNGLWTILLIACVIGYITCAIRSIRDFKSLKDESYETSCIRTTYDSSTNSLVSSTTTEYVGDDHIIEKMWLFFIYPIWGIFVYLYRIIKYYRDINKNYTKEAVIAYNKTVKETEKFILPNKFCYPHNIEEMFEIERKKYKELRQKTISKYSYLGNEQVKNQIKKLKKPAINLRSNQTLYKVLFNCGSISFVSNTSGVKKIIFNNYAIHNIDQKTLIDLFNFVNESLENDDNLSYQKIREIL